MRSASSASATTATPPTMSECPFRNLVAECMTMSAPSSSGRWIHGVRERIVNHDEDPAPACRRDHGGDIDELQQRIRRRLDPDHARLRPDRGRGGLRVREVRKGEVELRRAAAHPLEQAEAAAVEIVHRDHVIAGVDAARAASRSPPCRTRRRNRGCRPRGRRCSARRPCASGSACASTRSPCARRDSTGHRSRSHRSAASRRRSSGPVTARRGLRGWRIRASSWCPSSMPQCAAVIWRRR